MSRTEAVLFMCFFIGFRQNNKSLLLARPRITFVCVRFRKNNYLASCLIYRVTDGRHNGRNNSARLCWRLLVQADQGCPRLRWAMVDHGSQLASSRRSLCQGQKLSYSCVSLSALDKTANPYCWHIQGSCLFLSVCQQHHVLVSYLRQCVLVHTSLFVAMAANKGIAWALLIRGDPSSSEWIQAVVIHVFLYRLSKDRVCLCPFSKKQPSCSLPSFWGDGWQRQRQEQ